MVLSPRAKFQLIIKISKYERLNDLTKSMSVILDLTKSKGGLRCKAIQFFEMTFEF